jgi:hypothetical protein
MNYEAVAESVFNRVRAPGSTFWLELSLEKRQHWAEIVQAVEHELGPPLDEDCPDCCELRYQIDDFIDEVADLHIELQREKAKARA